MMSSNCWSHTGLDRQVPGLGRRDSPAMLAEVPTATKKRTPSPRVSGAPFSPWILRQGLCLPPWPGSLTPVQREGLSTRPSHRSLRVSFSKRSGTVAKSTRRSSFAPGALWTECAPCCSACITWSSLSMSTSSCALCSASFCRFFSWAASSRSVASVARRFALSWTTWIALGWKISADWVSSCSSKVGGRSPFGWKISSLPKVSTCCPSVRRWDTGTCSEKLTNPGSAQEAAAGGGRPRSPTSI